jgi:hypothetical protein
MVIREDPPNASNRCKTSADNESASSRDATDSLEDRLEKLRAKKEHLEKLLSQCEVLIEHRT